MIDAKFISREQIAEDTWMFTFSTSSLQYVPGQFITVFLEEESRDFTICPGIKKNTFSIITKISESPFKQKLFSLTKSSVIRVKEPSGGFVLRSSSKPKVFLAGGIGLIPFYAMLYLQKISVPITLLATFTTQEHMFFHNKLQELAKENNFIKVVFSLTNDTWNGEIGRISEKMIRKYVADPQDSEYYLAGGVAMVEDVEEMLLQMGIPQNNIIVDIFTGY